MKLLWPSISILFMFLVGCSFLSGEPDSVVEFDTGSFEDLVIGESKESLVERLKGTKHAFMPLPLNSERSDNWIYMSSTKYVTAMDSKEYGFLKASDLWEAGFVGYSTGCGCPLSTLHFSEGRLTKARVECWICK